MDPHLITELIMRDVFRLLAVAVCIGALIGGVVGWLLLGWFG